MASAHGGQQKKKQDQPLEVGGWGMGCAFYQILKPFNQFTFSERKENICSLRHNLILQSRGWAPSERPHFPATARARFSWRWRWGVGVPPSHPLVTETQLT